MSLEEFTQADPKQPRAHAMESMFKDGILADDRTVIGVLRAKALGNYKPPEQNAPHGYFKGIPIIGRDSPINKGIYIGGSEREGIVVDDGKDQILGQTFHELVTKIWEDLSPGKTDPKPFLTTIFNLVREKLPYSAAIVYQVGGNLKDEEILLGEFVKNKGGICRHQNLLTAYLLEKLIKLKLIKGKVSADRNKFGGSAHAWTRYESETGEVFIIDPAMNYVGPLQNAIVWFYDAVRRLPPEQQPSAQEQYLRDLAIEEETTPIYLQQPNPAKIEKEQKTPDLNAIIQAVAKAVYEEMNVDDLLNPPPSDQSPNSVPPQPRLAPNPPVGPDGKQKIVESLLANFGNDQVLLLYLGEGYAGGEDIKISRQKNGSILFTIKTTEGIHNKKAEDLMANPGAIRIGRSRTNDIVINRPDVSAMHCVITIQNGMMMINDNNSTNGISYKLDKKLF